MKKTSLIITALMLVVGCSKEPINIDELVKKGDIFYTKDTNKPYSGPVFSLYKNGQKKEEGTLKNGKADGKATEWYENGHKKYERTYKDGGHDGKYTEWNEDGQKKEWESRKEQLLDSINQLKNEQEELKEEQKKLLTDTTHIEDLARDLFRMALPKEKVFKTLPRSED